MKVLLMGVEAFRRYKETLGGAYPIEKNGLKILQDFKGDPNAETIVNLKK